SRCGRTAGGARPTFPTGSLTRSSTATTWWCCRSPRLRACFPRRVADCHHQCPHPREQAPAAEQVEDDQWADVSYVPSPADDRRQEVERDEDRDHERVQRNADDVLAGVRHAGWPFCFFSSNLSTIEHMYGVSR